MTSISQNKKVVIFYGSQTGTAEEFAERLAKEATRHGLSGMTFDPEEVSDWDDLASLKEIENSLAVFCVATYGEGDPTDNAQDLHSWLETGSADLTGVKYESSMHTHTHTCTHIHTQHTHAHTHTTHTHACYNRASTSFEQYGLMFPG